MPAYIVIPLVTGITLVGVILAGICYGVKEGIARLIERMADHERAH